MQIVSNYIEKYINYIYIYKPLTSISFKWYLLCFSNKPARSSVSCSKKLQNLKTAAENLNNACNFWYFFVFCFNYFVIIGLFVIEVKGFLWILLLFVCYTFFLVFTRKQSNRNKKKTEMGSMLLGPYIVFCTQILIFALVFFDMLLNSKNSILAWFLQWKT